MAVVWKYARGLGWAWGVIVIGIVANTLALWGLVRGREVGLPLEAWFVLSAFALLVAPLWPYHRLHKTIEGLTKQEPDLRIADFVSARLGEGDILEQVNPYLTDLYGLLHAVRERAVLGVIRVWGRRNCMPGLEDNVPRSEIRAKEWEEFELQIDALKFAQDPRGEAQSIERPNRLRSQYYDLWLLRAEADTYFPLPRRRRWRWQWPLVRVHSRVTPV